MNFDYSEDQLMIQQMTQDFAKKEISPNINVWDEKQYFPIDLFKKAGKQGLMGVLVPEKFGGSGLGYEEYILVVKEISKVCGAIGLSLAAHNSLFVNHLLKFGNDNQKNKWLPKLSSGQWIGAWGLTEPNTGSDAMRMKCVAEQDGEPRARNRAANAATQRD